MENIHLSVSYRKFLTRLFQHVQATRHPNEGRRSATGISVSKRAVQIPQIVSVTWSISLSERALRVPLEIYLFSVRQLFLC